MLFSALLCLLLSVGGASATSANVRLSNKKPIVEFLFNEGMTNPSTKLAYDNTGIGFLGSIDIGGGRFRTDGAGVNYDIEDRSMRGISKSTTANLISHFASKTDFTIEVWLRQPGIASGIDPIVFGFANYTYNAVKPPIAGSGGSPLYETELNGYQLQMYKWVSGNGADMKTMLTSQDAVPIANEITHIVASSSPTLSNPYSSWYNGKEGASVDGSFFMPFKTTPPNDHYLQLAPKFGIGEGDGWWYGDIFYLAIYDVDMSEAEALTQFNAWLPNSKPYAPAVVVSGLEDELLLVELTPYDFDIAFAYEMANRSPPITGFNILDTISVVISGVEGESLGTFYADAAGTVNVTATTESPYNVTDSTTTNGVTTFRVWFRPPKDQSGYPAAQWLYKAWDGFNFSSTSSITFNLDPVNDPPEPTTSTQPARAEHTLSSIVLGGSDPDSADTHSKNSSLYTIVEVVIETAPLKGSLFDWDGNVLISSVPHTVKRPLLYDITTEIVDPETGAWIRNETTHVFGSPYVIYEYTAPPTTLGSGSLVVDYDSFTFSVIDGDGLPSLSPATVTIAVYNQLDLHNATAVGNEDELFVIQLNGTNTKSGGNIVWKIRSLPTSGTLYQCDSAGDPVEASPITVGATVSNADGKVAYRGDLNLNDQIANYTRGAAFLDSFLYYASDPDAPVAFDSITVEMIVSVLPVNDPVVMVVLPSEKITVKISDSPTEADMFGVSFSDVDLVPDNVLIVLEIASGTTQLQLDQQLIADSMSGDPHFVDSDGGTSSFLRFYGDREWLNVFLLHVQLYALGEPKDTEIVQITAWDLIPADYYLHPVLPNNSISVTGEFQFSTVWSTGKTVYGTNAKTGGSTYALAYAFFAIAGVCCLSAFCYLFIAWCQWEALKRKTILAATGSPMPVQASSSRSAIQMDPISSAPSANERF